MIPFVNAFFAQTTWKDATKYIATIVVLASVVPSIISYHSIFSSLGGYSLIWLLVCYILGAYIRVYKNNITAVLSCKRVTGCYICWTILTLLGSFGAELMLNANHKFAHDFIKNLLWDYTKLPTLISAILLLLIFIQLKNNPIGNSRLVAKISSCTLGVYLLHGHSLVWKFLEIKTTGSAGGLYLPYKGILPACPLRGL